MKANSTRTGNPMVEIQTNSPEQTRQLGQAIGRTLKTGLAIQLCGDLGSGKTCLVQGLARGLAVPAGYDITSPTYTLINEYPGRLPLFHVDLYRLNDRVDAEMIGLWEIFGQQAVVAVEWAERLTEEDWPEEHLKIVFATIDDRRRSLRLIGCGLETDNLISEAVEIWQAGINETNRPPGHNRFPGA